MQTTLAVNNVASIFQHIIQDERFIAWKQRSRHWQLRLSGGPGSGKTILAKLITSHLQEVSNYSIMLIHIYSHRLSGDGSPTMQHPVCLENKFRCGNATRISTWYFDTENLLKALDDHEAQGAEVCLIIDGFDALQICIQDQLQNELYSRQVRGLKVLLLRAVPDFEAPEKHYVTCDTCMRGSRDEDTLYIRWSCGTCDSDICDPCKLLEKHCTHPNQVIKEPYNYIHIQITPDPSELEQFVRHDLEAEYEETVTDEMVKEICERGDNNINLTKLRLDWVRNLNSLHDIFTIKDRLPNEVVAFFDEEIQRIILSGPRRQRQALLALVAVSKEGSKSVEDLEKLLSDQSDAVPGHDGMDHPNVRDVLLAARGLLCTITRFGPQQSTGSECNRHSVTLFHNNLEVYIRESYNQDLLFATQRLDQIHTKDRLNCEYGTETIDKQQPNDPINHSPAAVEHIYTRSTCKQYSALNIIDAILQNPGNLCNKCTQTFIASESNRGLEMWAESTREVICQICLFISESMQRNLAPTEETFQHVDTSSFRWSRRTMGRTSNIGNIMVLTFRSIEMTDVASHKRLVFMFTYDAGRVVNHTQLGVTTGIEQTGEQIQRWLRVCKTMHPNCSGQEESSYVPTRLVDINTGTPGHCRIVEKSRHDMKGPYATLSHSWGPTPNFVKLTTDNKKSLIEEGFYVWELGNKNFCEAIQVALLIGVKYIWIDSLCICQEGKDGDFEVEGDLMHEVYRKSVCNIVAADSKDANGGLFRDRKKNFMSSSHNVHGWIAATDEQVWMALDKDMWANELLQSPIYKRGWVFQERLLSPRLIHFTGAQVFWDCCTVSACERFPDGLPFALSASAIADRRWRSRLRRDDCGGMPSESVIDDSLESFWRAAVLNYTSCNLSNYADKTKAIWSVAKLVRDQLEVRDVYGCGLWENELHEQLAWRAKNTIRGARKDALQSQFPSWSWASVHGPIEIRNRLVERRCYKVKDHKGGPVQFGEFIKRPSEKETEEREPEFSKSNFLALCGYLVPGYLKALVSKTYRFEFAQDSSVRVFLDEYLDNRLSTAPNCYFLPLALSKSTDQLGFYSGIGLILVPGQDSQEHARITLKAASIRGSTRNCGKQTELLLCFRRIGVSSFESLAERSWDQIQKIGEQKFFLT